MKINWNLITPLIIGVSISIGFIIGRTSTTQTSPAIKKTPNSSSFNLLGELINYIDAEYVDPVKKDELIDHTITNLLQELDPHSYYITPEEYAQMNEPLEGNFDGIGIQFNIQKDTLVVIDPISGGPSQQVGIKAGDRMVRVNDSLIAGVGIRNNEILKLLKGPKGTKVSVTIKRKKSPELNFTITRDKIPIHSVSVAYMLTENVGYIKVDRFGANTPDEFFEGVSKLVQKGASHLTVDLRGNGGGYMTAATDMLDGFFDKGVLLVYTEGKSRPKKEILSKTNAEFKSMTITVLIDESSASASEIFAGAIQDHDRGVIIGRRSFGKGLVQEQTMWPNGAATRLTIARYYTPSGRCIQKPYADGAESYNDEYYHRYQNGEMLSKDSIHIIDTAVYTTDKGRLVYGSGGIIPDVFVAIDTTQGSSYLNQLSYSGIIYGFAFDYADTHRKELSSNSLEKYISSFEVTDKILKALFSLAESEGIPYDSVGFKRSERIIKKRLKAYIARNIWNDEGFYPIWNADDSTIKASLNADETNILNK